MDIRLNILFKLCVAAAGFELVVTVWPTTSIVSIFVLCVIIILGCTIVDMMFDDDA